jgi:hypothetical protein
MKLGLQPRLETVMMIRNMALEMRREAKNKDLIDFTESKFLEKDYYEIHLDRYVVKRSEGAYDFALSYEWLPTGTIMEHFSCGHKTRVLVPNEAQMLAILLFIKDNQKAIQSKRGVCHWYTPVGMKRRDKRPEVAFQVLDKG